MPATTSTRLYRKLLLPNGVALLLLMLVALAYGSGGVAFSRDGLALLLLFGAFILVTLSALALSLGQLVEAGLDYWKFYRRQASRTQPARQRMRRYYRRLVAGSLGALLLWSGLLGWLALSILLKLE